MFAHLNADTARTYSLVLASAGIDHTVRQLPEGWAVEVPPHLRHHAQRTIRLYLLENPPRPITKPSLPAETAGSLSAVGAALLLLVIQWASPSEAQHQQMVMALGADARKIMAGEWYRCITALFLHNGWPHLVTNMAAALLFGTFTARLYGWGVAWCLILLSGAMGNFMAAAWYGRFHLSVGASTAIFGAVALCATATFWHRFRTGSLQWRTWVPLAAGLALVGWLGTSPRADLVAHLTGFLSGLLLGGIYGWRVDRPFSRPVQAMAMGVTAVLIASSWYWGYRVWSME